MPNYSYISRDALKLNLNDSVDTDDATYRRVLEAVSRAIDNHLKRTFRTYLATRVYTPREADWLWVDDLLAVTSLKTDEDDDLTYEVTWTANADYELYPYNAPVDEEPYYQLRRRPNGNYSFPAGHPQSVQVVGKWGYWEELETLTATAAEAIDASETAIDVSDGTVFDVLDTLLIGSEQLYVTAISTNTLTVVRAVNGTTAATHDTGAAIQRYRYPAPVVEACGIQAARYFNRKAAPFGVVGAEGVGFARLRGLDMDVKQLLEAYELTEVG